MKAFNSIGPGPDSDFIRITTNEGGKTKMFEMDLSTVGLKTQTNQLKICLVPEEPPQNVHCSPLTAESLRMNWDPPPIQSHHGIILGYKIHYKKVNPKTGRKFNNIVKASV